MQNLKLNNNANAT